MAKRRGRNIDGILLVDKPSGMSSNKVLQIVKRLYNAAKAGHTGSLDPLATGMLPICLGEATKFSQFLLDADKRYRTVAKLGVITASGDADGEVLETRPVEGISRDRVEALLAEHFQGEITQVPSMYSALKHKGQPLYKLARQGIEVERKARQVRIHSIRLLNLREDELELEVYCSKGTYVRSIVEDLGELLGCGAHVSVLRRLESGPYQASMMQSLTHLESLDDMAALDALLLPMETALTDFPAVHLDEQQSRLMMYGQSVTLLRVPTADTVILYNDTGRFIGLGSVSDQGAIAPKRLIRTQ